MNKADSLIAAGILPLLLLLDEDWGDDDMMQHPIDEGLRRVSFSFSCIVLMMTNLISIFDAYRHIVNLAKSVPIHVIVVPVAVNWIVRLNFVPVNQKQM